MFSCISKVLFISYKFGFDNGNIKAYSGMINMIIPITYLYFKREIGLYIAVFWWIPNFYYLYYVLGVPEITEIENGLYLANMCAITENNINKYNIKNIVEIHEKNFKKTNRFENINYLSKEIEDRSFIRIIETFDETNEFISKCIKNNENVVCHCSAGVSRSAAIVTAYLIYSGYSFNDSIEK
eukprot:41590_1